MSSKNAASNVFNGKIEDAKRNEVLEPIRVGLQALSSATDAAVMILRIDDVIAARSGGGGGGGKGGAGAGGDDHGDGEEY